MEEEDIMTLHLGAFLRGMTNAMSIVIIVQGLSIMHTNVKKTK